jgi:hypothetical protein
MVLDRAAAAAAAETNIKPTSAASCLSNLLSAIG